MHVLPHYREMCAKHCTPLGQNVQEKNVIFCIFFLRGVWDEHSEQSEHSEHSENSEQSELSEHSEQSS